MKLKDLGLILLALAILTIMLHVVVIADSLAEHNRRLDASIAELLDANVGLREQGRLLREDVKELREQLCRAMDTGRCDQEKGR